MQLKAPLPGSVLVGHVFLSVGKDGPPPVMGWGEDWKHELLPGEEVIEVIAAAGEDWNTELEDRLVSEDTVVFHVYVTSQDVGGQRIDFFDCACKDNPKPATTDN